MQHSHSIMCWCRSQILLVFKIFVVNEIVWVRTWLKPHQPSTWRNRHTGKRLACSTWHYFGVPSYVFCFLLMTGWRAYRREASATGEVQGVNCCSGNALPGTQVVVYLLISSSCHLCCSLLIDGCIVVNLFVYCSVHQWFPVFRDVDVYLWLFISILYLMLN